MKYEDIKTLKSQVEYCLKEYPQTRNSDIDLTRRVWTQFYGEYITPRGSLYLKHLGKMPTQAAIKRVRAKFQNDEGKYIPTSWEVANKRNFNEDEWKRAMGYNVAPKEKSQKLI